MIICKDLQGNQIITSVEEWFRICPPAKGEKHWKDGKSAKELARDWMKNRGEDLERLLASTPEFKEIKFEKALPEFESKLDHFKHNEKISDAMSKNKHLIHYGI